jgi:nucleoid-associated protein YgaU
MANSNSKRYAQRFTFGNNADSYADVLQRKNKRFIQQWSTSALKELTPMERSSIVNTRHTWKTGDRYYKLAAKYYNRPELWWVIAYYNAKPTEGHLRLGDTILIPTPIELLLKYM